MENVLLIVHLILALALILIVLLQRSEGGGLGLGGGGGGGVMTGRAAATALAKATWVLAIAFIATSIGLTIIAAEKSAGASVLDRLAPVGSEAPAGAPATTAPGLGDDLLPPTTGTAPLTPPRAD